MTPPRPSLGLVAALAAVLACATASAHGPAKETAFPIVAAGRAAGLVVDPGEAEVVRIAAELFAGDVAAVTGVRPSVAREAGSTPLAIVAGTLGHSAPIDALAAAGKLPGIESLRGRWEATQAQIVARPFPGVERALVIVGSDRRGTAYGLMRLSESIGVSPWTWWADVPAPRRKTLSVAAPAPETDAPAVRYRGIFINDEDWGLHQWAKRTYEPETGGIGPKTYARVFELLLRLRLNTLWPAMHECTREFHAIPENIALAGRYGIVMGASHCEPMLFNNAKWNQSLLGRWDYALNRERIRAVWEEQARTRGAHEAMWTMGIRGIHDQGMQGPPDVATRIETVKEVFRDQLGLLDRYVTKDWGSVAKCFVPYKEVLPLYDAGLPVPDDATIVWPDDNFGYIRRLGAPAERARSGGAGVYWHLSYYGFPHSYTWINTTAPALMREELGKAWDNDARRLWIVNVGDIKPMEIGIDTFARLAWNPEAAGPDFQPRSLRAFAARTFGPRVAGPVADLLGEFYRLGTIRKPELMNRAWATGLPDDEAATLRRDYRRLLDREARVAASIPKPSRDAYFETVGFAARVLGITGEIFLADREAQFGRNVARETAAKARGRADLEREVAIYNEETAGGKWRGVMPGLVTASNLTAWNSQVRWPWGEPAALAPKLPEPTRRVWRDAASADARTSAEMGGEPATWTTIVGLGPSGRAVALRPAGLASSWSEGDAAAPSLAFRFRAVGGGEALIDFLPSFRLHPGRELRVAVSVDDGPATLVEIPGSSGKEDENGPNRRNGVQNNSVRARVPLPDLTAGAHTLRIRAVDPGPVVDRISLPER